MRKNNTDALNEQYGESSFETVQDARNVGKALIDYCHGQEPSHRFTPIMILDLRAFAKFYAQRCGVVFTESINEKQ